MKELVQRIVSNLVFTKHWYFLEMLISCLAEIEMHLNVYFNKNIKRLLNEQNFLKYPGEVGNEEALFSQIPQNTYFCNNCPFFIQSHIAHFFYNTMDCYCAYLGKGDFSFISSTNILWTCSKECSINLPEEDSEHEFKSNDSKKDC